MKFLLSGYYGYANAGDEAVLAAILDHLTGQREVAFGASDASFIVAAGDTQAVETMHRAKRQLRAVGRQNPRAMLQAMRECDVFVSGGGSLLQDVTSLRNVVYYVGLMRLARGSRKPMMIYAQGLGPLHRSISQKLARIGMQSARVITLRDEASMRLARQIGVTRKIEVTADPVWALEPAEDPIKRGSERIWMISLRSWAEPDHAPVWNDVLSKLRQSARDAGAKLLFLPMQPGRDDLLLRELGVGSEANEEVLDGARHPRKLLAQVARCDLMIGMRLHALIFAASRSVPCVAINYDPKVEALAKQIGAPLLQNWSDAELARLPAAIHAARPAAPEVLADLRARALRNAELAISFHRSAVS